MGLTDIEEWVGKSETYIERISSFPSNALAATLNRNDPVYKDGMALPSLWHWLYFLPIFKLADAGYDGHAALGGFLPPIPLPRRMWAGSRLSFHAPMRIGEELKKISTVKSIKSKTGRSGSLVFVTIGHQIYNNNVLGIDEEHDIVYRERPSLDAPAHASPRAPEKWDFSRSIKPDPVLLFRYSALTFNGHRIHYDRPFCIDSDGYNGLIVHGPLLATLLLDLLRDEKPDAEVQSFEFRAIAPVIDTETFSVHGEYGQDRKHFKLWIMRQDGALAMQAEATLV